MLFTAATEEHFLKVYDMEEWPFGEGCTSDVFRAHNPATGAHFAVKVPAHLSTFMLCY